MFSQAEENYLKTIYALEGDRKNEINTNLIAKKIDAKASSVTDMLKKLSEKKLVVYKKYQGVKLSGEGKKVAIATIRKHRLWESFLVQKLNFSWDEVHDIAEQLEHIKSESLINKLDAFLGFPTVDPHGDPIPDKNGNITRREKVKLSDVPEETETVLLGVKDSSDDFLKYLNKKDLSIGTLIKVLSVETFDKSMIIETDVNQILITHEVAKNLWVKAVKQDE